MREAIEPLERLELDRSDKEGSDETGATAWNGSFR